MTKYQRMIYMRNYRKKQKPIKDTAKIIALYKTLPFPHKTVVKDLIEHLK